MAKPNYNDYNKYMEYLEDFGWIQNNKVITEKDTDLVTLYSCSEHYCLLIDLKCPNSKKISVIGNKQIPKDLSSMDAYSLSIRLANINYEEVSQLTQLRLVKYSCVSGIYPIKTVFYKDINMSLGNDKKYRFDNGFELNGEDHFEIYILKDTISSSYLLDTIIDANYTKFELEADIWTSS